MPISPDEARLRAVVDTAVDGVILIDAKGAVLMFNPACERLFGYAAEEVIGRNVKMLMPPPYREAHDGYLGNYLGSGERKIIGIGREVVGQRKDGTTFPMHLSVGEAKLEGTSTFVGILHDLTDRNRADASRARLAAIVESSNDAIIGKDLDGNITSWNRGAERLYGYTAAEAVGRPITITVPAERHREVFGLIARIRNGEDVASLETIRVAKDGRQLDISLTLSPVMDAQGALTGISAVGRDITELRRAERQIRELTAELLHTSRLSAMGQLASSLAHELNQPLTAIINYAEAARETMKSVEASTPRLSRVVGFLERTSSQAERAGEIIRRLRAFVEKGSVEHSDVRLSDAVKEASALATIGAHVDGIQVSYELASNLPIIKADKVQIQQVIVNLVRNAVEALAATERRQLRIRTELDEHGNQRVSVIDTGQGLPPEIERELFKPFVSTKPGGMGIGLSISRSIIEAHGGRIWVEPNPQGGTVFRFSIPSGAGSSDLGVGES